MVKRIADTKALPLRTYFKEWRKFAGLTQKDLARRFGVAEGTISRIERGERDFTGKFLATFVEAVGCPNPGDPINRPPDQISVDGAIRLAPDELQDYLRRRGVEIVGMLQKPSSE